MENENSPVNPGQPDRQKYWLDQINQLSPEELAIIIADLEKRATRDQLTGLINEDEFKKQFDSFVNGAFRNGKSVYIFFMDFDKLKKINDERGHDAGNEYLKKGANVIVSSLRSSDLVARLHGDEFVAAVEFDKNMPSTNPEIVIQRLVSNLETSEVSVSVGAKEFKSGDGLEEILTHADHHMMLDKDDRNAGRSNI